MIHAVIFDMDGVIIDSEPYWNQSMIEVFNALGIRFTVEECQQTTGLRIGEVTKYWFTKRPWTGPSTDEVAEQILQGVIRRVKSSGVLMRGFREAISLFQRRGYQIALATSSASALMDTVIDKFALRSIFPIASSAEFEPNGKPHPAVFLTTAKIMSVPPTECLVIEDSVNGLRAAKAANMRCILIPTPGVEIGELDLTPDLQLSSLSEISDSLLDRLEKIS